MSLHPDIAAVLAGDSEGCIVCGDCLELMADMPDGCVDLVCTDPPYNGTLTADWDNAWSDDAAFLGWLGSVFDCAKPAMADNASLYAFASPRMVGRVEAEVRVRFNVLASIVWQKGVARKGVAGTGIDVTALRTYWPMSERIVFAEMRGGDGAAEDAAGYTAACESLKVSIVGVYLKGEIARAGASHKEIAALFPSRTGGLTGCVSNWVLGANMPTAQQYAAIREYLNRRGANDGDYLRREYEDLRREYEDLRRAFFLAAGDQWGDVWAFELERRRQHPAQKPLSLMVQIVRASSRLGDIILDPFVGSGTTCVAAKKLGRRWIGIEIDETYCEIARRRLRDTPRPLFTEPVEKKADPKLFEKGC